MVYYGLLLEEDAQCFGIRGSIEPGSFTLVGAAVVLALLNSFVTKATKQYNYYLEQQQHDDDDVIRDDEDDVEKSSNDDDEEKVVTSSSPKNNKLRPIPVMFTDTYRWLLRGERQ